MIPGLIGAPLIGDIMTVGQITTRMEMDEDSTMDAVFGWGHYGELSGDETSYQLYRILNSQFARFRHRTWPMVTSGHGFMGLQTDLGLYPSSEVKKQRENVSDFLGELSPELEASLRLLLNEEESRRKKVSY